jgi:regulator of replication initiation timing
MNMHRSIILLSVTMGFSLLAISVGFPPALAAFLVRLRVGQPLAPPSTLPFRRTHNKATDSVTLRATFRDEPRSGTEDLGVGEGKKSNRISLEPTRAFDAKKDVLADSAEEDIVRLDRSEIEASTNMGMSEEMKSWRQKFEKFEKFEGQIFNLTTEVGRLQNFEAQVGTLMTEVATLTTKVGNLTTEVSRLQKFKAQVGTLTTEVSNLTTEVGTLTSEVGRLQKFEAQVGTLTTEVLKLKKYCWIFGNTLATIYAAEIALDVLGRPPREHKAAKHAAHAWKQGPELKNVFTDIFRMPKGNHTDAVDTMDIMIHLRNLGAHVVMRESVDTLVDVLDDEEDQAHQLTDVQAMVLLHLRNMDKLNSAPRCKGFGVSESGLVKAAKKKAAAAGRAAAAGGGGGGGGGKTQGRKTSGGGDRKRGHGGR